ncbi:U3 small nucleolar RNA-associated protein 11 [Sporormia fimetaria CBS 119925]|uniref:U3 small nucleolar RNA-associated protein 11 n=1 Tax=Sporormia fimetaria CBS 119925 TaxID=1340428 RepID=A0A6A6VPB3_9PLEO|nr:U3 small nucleolar RNA-associated protein 11 [Sporormia fimetaria CBS 119925]
MSSMRNAVQRRNHKERAQPLEREKWGLLEKRKDYKLRATNHKEKQKKLKLLKQKAAERNPDEFSFAMVSSKVDSAGRKIADRGNTALSMDVVKLLKTQDVGYIRTMLQMVRKEREQLEQKIMVEGKEVVPLGKDEEVVKKGRHTVFVGDRNEQRKFRADEWFGKPGDWSDKEQGDLDDLDDEEEEDDGKKKTLSKKELEKKALKEKEERAFRRRREKTLEKMEALLEAVKKRERDLVAAEDELDKQRAKMHNTVGGVNKNGVKFKIRERKR